MNHNHEQRLVNFIRQYQPSPPPPKAGLEEEIMAQLEAPPPTEKVVFFPKSYSWAFGGVIAASVLAVFASVRILQPIPSSPQQTAELEVFLTENWEALTIPSSTDTSWEALTTESTESSNRR